MKYLLILFIALSVGCSTTKKDVESANKISSTFLGGSIKVSYTKDGQFDFLTSTANAPVTSQLPSARDEAVTVATIKARRQISEFISTEVQSERFISSVSNSLQNSEVDSKNTNSSNNSKIAYEVRENIKQKSNAILQGTFVENEQLDTNSGLIVVTVRAGRKESDLAKSIKQSVSK